VSLSVFNLSGQIVRTYETTFTPTGYRSEPIKWDGCDETGVPLAKGMYLYRINVRNESGQTDGKTGKLILVK
jgi:flagellar hook assembly protein FlgD